METRQLRRAAERPNLQLATAPFSYAIYPKHFAICGEDPAELAALKADLRADHRPANTTEEILVNEMAEQFWRIRRFRTREIACLLLDEPEHVAMAELKLIPMIQRLMSAAERGFHKALTTLRQLQKDRGFVPHSSEHTSENTQDKEETALAAAPGFVPQNDPQYSQEVNNWFNQAVADGDLLPEDTELRDLHTANLAELRSLA